MVDKHLAEARSRPVVGIRPVAVDIPAADSPGSVGSLDSVDNLVPAVDSPFEILAVVADRSLVVAVGLIRLDNSLFTSTVQ